MTIRVTRKNRSCVLPCFCYSICGSRATSFSFFILTRANLFRRVYLGDFEIGDVDLVASKVTEPNLTGTKFVRKNLLPVCTSFCLLKTSDIISGCLDANSSTRRHVDFQENANHRFSRCAAQTRIDEAFAELVI